MTLLFCWSANAAVVGTLDYVSSTLKFWNGTTWVEIGNRVVGGSCSTAGRYEYSVGDSSYRFCDGTNWYIFSAGVTAGTCTNVGALDYSQTDETFRFCNGSNWMLTSRPPGYFVLTAGSYTGSLGGQSGADTTCYNDLNSNVWRGKTAAQSRGIFTAAQVTAFLCSGANACVNLPDNTKFYFAIAGNTLTGGASFTTDGSGLGPGDMADWGQSTYFGGTYYYWSNRGASTHTSWLPTQYGSSCNGWTTTVAVQGSLGNTGSGSYLRWWAGASGNCTDYYRLVCVVSPGDMSVGSAVSFTDLTGQTTATTVTSNVIQITGISVPAAVDFMGTTVGNPQSRVCSDSGCSSVVTTWASHSVVANNQYLQLRVTTSGNASTVRSNTVKVGLNAYDTWDVTTAAGSDNTPTGFNFTTLTNQPVGTLVNSNIAQVTSFTSADVSSPNANYSYRVCSDGSCTGVVYDWSSSSVPREVTNSQYLQMRVQTSYAGTTYAGSLTVGTITPTWSATTSASSGGGAFVLTATTYTGNMGGRTGADALCLTELQNTNWIGKGNVTLNSTKVKAFLCDNTTCTNLQASTSFRFAVANDPFTGGATFTTDASGLGPNDNITWYDPPYLGYIPNYWTGRAAGSDATKWPSTSSGTTCNAWASNLGTDTGTYGWAQISQNRWSVNVSGCNGSLRMICFVNP